MVNTIVVNKRKRNRVTTYRPTKHITIIVDTCIANSIASISKLKESIEPVVTLINERPKNAVKVYSSVDVKDRQPKEFLGKESGNSRHSDSLSHQISDLFSVFATGSRSWTSAVASY